MSEFLPPVGKPHPVTGIVLLPSSGGVFDVRVNDELVFSKRRLGRHAPPEEILPLIRDRLQRG